VGIWKKTCQLPPAFGYFNFGMQGNFFSTLPNFFKYKSLIEFGPVFVQKTTSGVRFDFEVN
jgi:hypothetical protein